MPNGEPQPGNTPAVEGTPVGQRTPINSLGESETPRGLKEPGYTVEEIRLFFAARQLPKGISGDPDEARYRIKDFLTQRGVAIPEDDKLEEVIVEMLANPQNYPMLSSLSLQK